MINYRFVSATKPGDYADSLHEVQLRIKVLKKEIKVLELQEQQLSRYLLNYSATTFRYTGNDGYKKVVKIAEHSRMILDQSKVLKLLKSKTPYTESTWKSIKIDWIYE